MMNNLEQSMKCLVENLEESKEPGSYYGAWQANIAMAVYDTFPRGTPLNESEIHELSNKAAQRFLEQLIQCK